jgi:hypothetical protein
LSFTKKQLGDGQMLSYHIVFKHSVPVLRNARQTMVGTYCTAMYPFYHEGEQKIFITGIRPTIITSWHQKLLFSAVNLKVKKKKEKGYIYMCVCVCSCIAHYF